MIYLPNIRKCMFVTGLNDPQANKTHFVGLVILSSESEYVSDAPSVIGGNTSVIVISDLETVYIICFNILFNIRYKFNF